MAAGGCGGVSRSRFRNASRGRIAQHDRSSVGDSPLKTNVVQWHWTRRLDRRRGDGTGVPSHDERQNL